MCGLWLRNQQKLEISNVAIGTLSIRNFLLMTKTPYNSSFESLYSIGNDPAKVLRGLKMGLSFAIVTFMVYSSMGAELIETFTILQLLVKIEASN
jgi:hypothetical protein